MDLHTAGHRRGVVAAPHHAAAEAGRAILAEGGNALEAMVAMAAAIAAVYPHMNHVGGDGFWLVRERTGRVRALMAAGRAGGNAPASSSIAMRATTRSRRAGRLRRSPRRPRSPAGRWRSKPPRRTGGRMPLAVLLEAAIRHARDGYKVTASQARLTAEKFDELVGVPGFAATFLVDGKPPAAATVLRQPALAATLDHLANAGLDDFYRGDVGREIAADLERIGSPVTRADLEAVRATVAEPLSARDRRRHALQRAAADPGACLAHHPRPVRRGCACRAPRASSTSTASSRRPSGHSASATASSPIPIGCRAPLAPFLDAEIPRCRGGADRPPQGGAMAGRPRRRRHRLDGGRRRRRARRLLHPVDLLGVRLRLRAAARPAC